MGYIDPPSQCRLLLRQVGFERDQAANGRSVQRTTRSGKPSKLYSWEGAPKNEDHYRHPSGVTAVIVHENKSRMVMPGMKNSAVTHVFDPDGNLLFRFDSREIPRLDLDVMREVIGMAGRGESVRVIKER